MRMLVLSSGGLLFGFYFGVMNALGVPIIQGVLGYEKNEESSAFNTIYGMTNFLTRVGALVGNVCAGRLSHFFGRRPVFYIEVLVMALAIAPALIANTPALLISRFMLGVSGGINMCIYNVMLAELLPNKLCGIGGGMGVFFVMVGVLLSSVSQNIWSYDTLVKYWRWLVIYPMVVELMRVVAFPFLFKTETPIFIFNKILRSSQVKPKSKKSKMSKMKITRSVPTSERTIVVDDMPTQTDTDEHIHTMAYAQIRHAKSYIYSGDRVDIETVNTLKHLEYKASMHKSEVGFKKLFSKHYRRQFYAGCYLCVAHEFCGAAFLYFYSTLLFDEISGNGKLITLIIDIVNIASAVAGVFSVAYIGRKPNLVIGLLIQGVGLMILAISYKTLNVLAIMSAAILFAIGFSLGIGGARMIYLGETLPPAGVGIAFGIQCGFNAILGLVIPLFIESIGPMPLIIFFMIFCFASTIFSQIFLIETRNKTSEEIYHELNQSVTHMRSRSKKFKIEPK